MKDFSLRGKVVILLEKNFSAANFSWNGPTQRTRATRIFERDLREFAMPDSLMPFLASDPPIERTSQIESMSLLPRKLPKGTSIEVNDAILAKNLCAAMGVGSSENIDRVLTGRDFVDSVGLPQLGSRQRTRGARK